MSRSVLIIFPRSHFSYHPNLSSFEPLEELFLRWGPSSRRFPVWRGRGRNRTSGAEGQKGCSHSGEATSTWKASERAAGPDSTFFLVVWGFFFGIRISGKTGHPEIVLTCAACEGTNPVMEASGRWVCVCVVGG